MGFFTIKQVWLIKEKEIFQNLFWRCLKQYNIKLYRSTVFNTTQEYLVLNAIIVLLLVSSIWKFNASMLEDTCIYFF